MRVLIADDDPIFRTLLERQLRGWGYDVITAIDGKQAWDLLTADPAPHIAILDWQMPGQDGVDICHRLRAHPELPFTYTIMLTSRDTREDMVAGLDAGADDYLGKPVDPVVLRSHLSAASRIVQAVPPKEWSLPRVEGYEVIKLLGRGMSGTVWRARQLSDGREVALKIIRRDLVTAEMLARFGREISITRELHHPNIAEVYESRFDATICYYAMELVDGPDLARYVNQQHPRVREVVGLMVKICAGVEHAHSRNVVHRDLKPANILLTAMGEPKIVDFGLAKFLLKVRMTDEAHTLQDTAIGTPLYMSPEQASGRNDRVDCRSDVYALGTMLYLILTGHHPHKLNRITRWEFVRSIAQSDVRPLRLFKPGIDVRLEQTIMKALAREPDSRYPTAGPFGQALKEVLENAPAESLM